MPTVSAAQDAQTLADIRQELTILNTEMTKLRRELSTTGTAGGAQLPASVLERVGAMESELARVTSKSEELEHRINRIVADGTRRVADLEFRLVELEGGDISALGARRANAAREYLLSKGVPASRLRVVSYGKERPIEICSNEACYAKNRRAVTVLAGGLTS